MTDIDQHLADFGDTPQKRGYRRKSARSLAMMKSVAPYQHIVVHRPATPRDAGDRSPAFNRPAEKWQARYPATRSLDERVPFAWHLSGIDPERVDLSEYDWTVP